MLKAFLTFVLLSKKLITKQRYFIELVFKGTNYCGWQIQENAVSIQEELNKALSTLFSEEMETVGAGRTDAGVHARQFFAHFEIDERKIDKRILRDCIYHLNCILPDDIAIKVIFPVPITMHARFTAISRSYEYHIYRQKNPFLKEFAYLLHYDPDIDKMNKASAILYNYEDFSCFSKSRTQVKTNICKITKAEWVVKDDKIIFYITANRFLRNMVRAIVGTLLEVGKNEITVEDFAEIIESKNRSNAGFSVPACGLYLSKITYPSRITSWEVL